MAKNNDFSSIGDLLKSAAEDTKKKKHEEEKQEDSSLTIDEEFEILDNLEDESSFLLEEEKTPAEKKEKRRQFYIKWGVAAALIGGVVLYLIWLSLKGVYYENKFKNAAALIEAAQTDKALAELNKFQKNHYDNPLLYYYYAQSYENAGDYDKAEEFYKEAVKVQYDHKKSLTAMVRLYAETGRVNEAREAAELLRRYFYSDADAQVVYGDFSLKQGDVKEASSSFKYALSIAPGHTAALKYLRKINVKNGNYQAAGDYDKKLGDKGVEPESADDYTDVIRIYMGLNQYHSADYYMEKALREFPEDIEVIKLQAQLALIRNRPDLAQSAVTKLFQKDIRTPDVFLFAGEVSVLNNNLREAYDYFKAALDIDPLHYEINSAMAELQIELDNYNSAVYYLKQALRVKQDDYIFSNLGYAYFMLGDFNSALQNFRNIQDRTNEQKYNEAVCLMFSGNYDAALALFDEIEIYIPNVFKLYNNKGAIYEMKGDLKKAMEYYFKAVDKKLGDEYDPPPIAQENLDRLLKNKPRKDIINIAAGGLYRVRYKF